ncbi:hypothetical protein LAZ67_7001234 [Cordylochernes scorpioides]|uniref:Uncharacterized protein n=1 Tax=Cordylochernes scorpioides TaxID=51811 RepID=A0ABY6KM41_9ARAC|nr:hypothetical protein LAZ67_7001234 [Cordylochernes scorpioides]
MPNVAFSGAAPRLYFAQTPEVSYSGPGEEKIRGISKVEKSDSQEVKSAEVSKAEISYFFSSLSFSKMEGHILVGLSSVQLADKLIEEGLDIEDALEDLPPCVKEPNALCSAIFSFS